MMIAVAVDAFFVAVKSDAVTNDVAVSDEVFHHVMSLLKLIGINQMYH